MLDKLKNAFNLSISDMNFKVVFGVGGAFALFALIHIILRLVRPTIQSNDYVWLIVADVILALVFFAMGMYIRSKKK